MQTDGVITDADNPPADKLRTATDAICEEYLAILLLSGANYTHFEKLCKHLSNLFAMGDDRYLKMVVACLSMLDHYNSCSSNKPQQSRPPKQDAKQAVIFAQNAKPDKSKMDKPKDQPGNDDTSIWSSQSSSKGSTSSK